MKLRAYVAGPMAGKENFNFELFDHVTKRLRSAGYEVLSPADHARAVHGTLAKIKIMHPKKLEAAIRKLLAYELNWICLNADIVFLLPGWASSRGACAERAAALACGIEIKQVPDYFLPEGHQNGGDHTNSTEQSSDTGSHLFTT